MMIDTGRRFYPVDFVERLLDGMATNKMCFTPPSFAGRCTQPRRSEATSPRGNVQPL